MSGYVGLIGSTKAQKTLGKMLEECGNKQVVKVVTRRLFHFKHGCEVIAKMAKVDSAMAYTMLKLWHAYNLGSVDSSAKTTPIPDTMLSYWKNCMKVDYRKALVKIRNRNKPEE